ncbi:MAG TPA: threonine--tRNA ligase [Clostridiales bacterium]|nr:threonine--tRNA ligase [Clostridiales bacterium]
MQVIMANGQIEEHAFAEEIGRTALRHTAAHVLAQAVKRLYPQTMLAIGPAIKDGFYYDFDRETPFTEPELAQLETAMQAIVRENLKLERFTLPRAEAVRLMESRGEPYKIELIRDLPEEAELVFFQQGEYVDLCAGPHVTATAAVKACKLTAVAGAYWRGSEKNKMLTRIYGTAFANPQELADYLGRLEEAKRRDHRKLGRELGLFALMDEGPGFPFFLPKGLTVKNELIRYWREIHTREGYLEISTPVLLNRELWQTSGHWDLYHENMYTTSIDETDFAIKPMNCPGGMLVYKMEPHSYRDLPLKIGELGLVHRHEKSGVLHGLMRVRCFTQDDAHIYMTEEQITGQIQAVARLIDEVYRKFGFQYHVELSTMPEHHLGTPAEWELAISSLKDALDTLNLPYGINEGDGAFYGPKIDFHLEDSLGRTWQCGTIQLDFQLPLRFDAQYTGADGQKHRPIMIHRVIYGSLERFIGILIEHYAGKFPTWLAPVQVCLLPIADRHFPYADRLAADLRRQGVRCEIDRRPEKIGFKVREAQMQKIPYMLVIGDQETAAGSVAVRRRDGAAGETQDAAAFIRTITAEISARE